MQHAIYLPNYGAYGDARTLAALARDAEQAGWDGFFVWDHMTTDEALPVVDPWVALAAVALATQHIRLGTTVTPLPRRRPWKVARETVSLDRLSGGRLVLGVGTGLGAREWDDLGEESDPKVRGAMLDEALDVISGLWRGEPFSYDGAHYHVRDAHFLPVPHQPRIPIWVGGFWPNKAPMRRAARWDGVFPLVPSEEPAERLEQFTEAARYVLDQRAALGLSDPFDVIAVGFTWPHADPAGAAAAADAYQRAGATWWLEGIVPWRFGYEGRGAWPVEAMRARVLQGPPGRG